MPWYHFQPTRIWDGGNDDGTPDESQPIVGVKIQKGGPERARKRLPSPGLGRTWVHVNIDGSRVER